MLTPVYPAIKPSDLSDQAIDGCLNSIRGLMAMPPAKRRCIGFTAHPRLTCFQATLRARALTGQRLCLGRRKNAITPVAMSSTATGSASSARVSYTAFIGGSAGTENEALWKAQSPT